jgi:hypothetical protein
MKVKCRSDATSVAEGEGAASRFWIPEICGEGSAAVPAPRVGVPLPDRTLLSRMR